MHNPIKVRESAFTPINAKQQDFSQMRDDEKSVLLYESIHNGDIAKIQLLINHGINVNDPFSNGETALLIAAAYGHIDIIKLLLSHGADVNVHGECTPTPLYLAAQMGHLEVVKLLLENQAEVDFFWPNGLATPLLIALGMKHLKIADLLLNYGAGINVAVRNSLPPLVYAALYDLIEGAHLLLNKGANVDVQCSNGESPLSVAANNGHFGMVRLLLDKNAAPNTQERSGETPLFMAVRNGHIEVVQLLIAKGANITTPRIDGVSPLFIAAENEDDSMILLLIDKIKHRSNQSPRLFSDNELELENKLANPITMKISTMLIAAQRNDKEQAFIELLRKNNLDNNDTIENFSTLHWAVLSGHQATSAALETAMPVSKYNGKCALTVESLKKLIFTNITPSAGPATSLVTLGVT